MSRLAERLGFSSSDRIAVVHVDDLGMCHAANEGGFAALESGPATCGSIMVPCPWFREAADRAREDPRLDVGVHLTLNAEWPHYRWQPVAGRRAVPSLVDDQGFLPRTSLETVQRAKPEEVEIELRGGTHLIINRSRKKIGEGTVAPVDLMVDDVEAMRAYCQKKRLKPSKITSGSVHSSFHVPGPDGWSIKITSSHTGGRPV